MENLTRLVETENVCVKCFRLGMECIDGDNSCLYVQHFEINQMLIAPGGVK